MSLYLFLFRHAEAEEKKHQSDKNRQLTSAGREQAARMGGYLSEHHYSIDKFISSTAVRARETTQLAVDAMRSDPHGIQYEDLLYEASTREFFDYVTGQDNNNKKILIVGHNPTISNLVEYLSRAKIGSMATAGVAVIRFNVDAWNKVSEGSGELLKYIYPAMIDQMT